MNNENSDRDFIASEAEVGLAGRRFDRNRRKLTVAGLSAPILMTLVSKPALAGNCLSNMMSGNLSDPDRGLCELGWSPADWGDVNSSINGSATPLWVDAGYNFDSSTLMDLPFAIPDNLAPETLLSDVLQNHSTSSSATYVAAWLNANLSANSEFQYILTPDQFLGLLSDPTRLPPGYVDLKAFLDSTWL